MYKYIYFILVNVYYYYYFTFFMVLVLISVSGNYNNAGLRIYCYWLIMNHCWFVDWQKLILNSEDLLLLFNDNKHNLEVQS